MRSSTCSWVVAIAACGGGGHAPVAAPTAGSAVATGSATAPIVPAGAWPIPDGWRAETLPFPLSFAPSIAHKGVEELRFGPGMFDPAAARYWSYAFAWRLDDAAQVAPAQLADELTAYFRGLLVAVDADKHRIADPTAIKVDVDAQYAIRAHVIDAFATGQPVDLDGFAQRTTCNGGALWVFGFAPAGVNQLAAVHDVAAAAQCGQPVVTTAAK
jgi:RNA polymerase subunit RPABC4/transcription elongation factor Spt4